ncbi:MAG: TSUP family transporter [Clostridia bacterium]|nr:TSUP family transporter [Clostridia bacterium]
MWRLLAVLLTATLSGLGVGSAGILVLYLVRVEGLAQLTAQGLNLIFFLCSSGVSLLLCLRKAPPLWRYQGLLLLLGVPGALLGAELAHFLPEGVLRCAFGIFLMGCGVLGLFGKKKD